jgi:cation diffusion facilitator family transporter
MLADMAETHESPTAVYTAMVANTLIVITKFVAAAFTGSSAMVSEGIHSVVDSGNQLLLLLGFKLAQREPDEAHPYGHGQELYFWGLVVAIILFGVGGGMSFYEGLTHLQHPTEMADVQWNYVVLGLSFIFESVSFVVATRKLLRQRPVRDLWHILRTSKDPSVFIVVMEDFTDLLGLIIALAGILAAKYFHDPRLDGAASLLIGLTLGAAAIFLAYQTRGLLLGGSADAETRASIKRMAEASQGVERVGQILTMHLGPADVLLNLTVRFAPALDTTKLAAAIDDLERHIQAEHPEIKRVFIEAEALAAQATGDAAPQPEPP